ncbi:MAG: sulfopyruvate decarboxylase [Deltaproteobacteria bacterium]|nr:sulfopyruvate decarboxylase [Deltaproteobacteria bacterium]
MEPRLASLVIEGLKRAHVRFVVGLPDSMLAGVYVAAEKDHDIKYIQVTNEAEGASVAAGAWMAGGRSVLVMENSGLRAACEALARLGLVNGVPVTMLMGYRGDLGERFHWGVNHGMTMEPLLKALRIPYWIIDRKKQIIPAVTRAVIHGVSSLYHTAVVFRTPLVNEGK